MSGQQPLTPAEAKAYHLGRAILELIDMGVYGLEFGQHSNGDWEVDICAPWDDPVWQDADKNFRFPDLVSGLIDIAEEAAERKGKAGMRTDGDR